MSNNDTATTSQKITNSDNNTTEKVDPRENIKELLLFIPNNETLHVYIPKPYVDKFLKILGTEENHPVLSDENKLYEFYDYYIKAEMEINLEMRMEKSYKQKVNKSLV